MVFLCKIALKKSVSISVSLKLSVLKVNRTVNKRSCLKFVLMVIFHFCKVFNKVYVFSISYINSTGSFSTEFMKMLIGKISMEFYFMVMIVFIFAINSFTCYCTESMIMTIITFIKNSCISC